MSTIKVDKAERGEKEDIVLSLLLLMCEQRWLQQVVIAAATPMDRCGSS